MNAAPDDPPTPDTGFSVRRRWRIGWNVVLSCTAVLALVLMANYLAARHHHRFQWTPDERFDLSQISRQLLGTLTNDVRVTVFYDRDDLFFSAVTGLLREYVEASPRIKVTHVDPTRYPDEAMLVKSRYQIHTPVNRNMIIFDCEGRYKIVQQADLSDYDFQIDRLLEGEREVKRTGFKGEQLFTSALLSVTDLRPQRACHVSGHGEHALDVEDDLGYSRFKGVLKASNIELETINLRTNGVPDWCHLLVVASPRLAFLPEELDRIEAYLRQGGRLLAAFSYFAVTNRTGLESLLARWGVEVGANVVLDRQNTVKGSDLFATEMAADHPITKPLIAENAPLYLYLPRTIRALQSRSADAPKTIELVSTSPTSVTVSKFAGHLPEPGPRDPVGSAPVIVAVEKGQIEGLNPDRATTRILVLGDSTFLSNFAIENLANRAFAGYAVNWLLDRSALYGGIGPKPIAQYDIKVSKSQLRSARWIMLGAMPGAALALGLLVWLRRRA